MITLVPATAYHIPLVRKLARVIWHEVFASIITPEQIELMLDRMYNADTIRQEMAAGVVWKVLTEDYVPIGYVSYSMTGPGECTLHKIYVHPAHHGKGFGKRLMQEAGAYAQVHRARTLSLRVNRANAKALRAYRAFGFREVASINWEFAPGFTLHDYKLELSLAGAVEPKGPPS